MNLKVQNYKAPKPVKLSSISHGTCFRVGADLKEAVENADIYVCPYLEPAPHGMVVVFNLKEQVINQLPLTTMVFPTKATLTLEP